MPVKRQSITDEQINRFQECCSSIMHRYFFKISLVQEKVHTAWKNHIADKFNFMQDTGSNKRLDLINVVVDGYRTEFTGSDYINLVWETWNGKTAKESRKDISCLKPHHKEKLEVTGRILASLLIVNAEYQKAIIVLDDLVLLNPTDPTSRLILMKLAAQLEEWDVLKALLKREIRLSPLPIDYSAFPKLYDLYTKFILSLYTQPKRNRLWYIGTETEPHVNDKRTTYGTYEALALAHRIRSDAARRPYTKLEEIGDPISNREQEVDKCMKLLKNRLPSIFLEAERADLFRQHYKKEQFEKLMTREESLTFLKTCTNLAIHFDTRLRYLNECLETGILRDAQHQAMAYWQEALKLPIPIQYVNRLSLFISYVYLSLIRAVAVTTKVFHFCTRYSISS
ncbi:hypothetical protein L596_006138 [Steinernema carpocapsae]|uniref:Uncharacterized protein n=1 Tax=Steinernema carpocapsae TaxID=34508 RepID=A0A4U8V6R6_STECR|nr:hypothetical protein L596_006138 [Steinernema carpocapsae]